MGKKVGIVSCYFQPNYGSMIQALATQMALDKLGYDNETIEISGFTGEIKRAKLKYYIKASLTSDILVSKLGRAKDSAIRRIAKNAYTRNVELREKAFRVFAEKNFRLSSSYSSKEDLGKTVNEKYSAILVGSDQLWLPGNIAADYYTLNWVPRTVNTIAYATSFGQADLPRDSRKKASVFLQRIRHIGVREESGQKLIKQIVDRDVPIVCDPTLLFSGTEWLSIQNPDPLFSEPYIFAYFLGNNPPHRSFVKKLSLETGCKIVALPHLDEYVKSDCNYADYTPYEIDPGEFINLIRNAKYVCTDSFHCSVFSLQYEKTFFAFRRYSRNTMSSTNSRLDTLFRIAGVDNRILSGDEEISECLSRKIDYSTVNKCLESIRAESYEYLRHSLADDRSTDI